MKPSPPHRPCSNTRRSLLFGSAAFIAAPLVACGGGGGGGGEVDAGGGGGGGGGGGSSAGPSGSLVYRNSGVAAVYSFSTKTELQFNPGTAPFGNPGMAVSPTGIVTSAKLGDQFVYFDVGLFGLDGRSISTLRMRRELASQTGAAVYNADGSRLALSLNEPTSASVNARVDRVVVLAMPAGTTVATIDGYEEPIWLGNSGELVVRDPNTKALYRVSADLRTVTRLADLVSSTFNGAYSASADGRFIVYQPSNSNSSIRAYDRSNNTSWVAATDRLSDLKSPVLSPDGRFMAVHSRFFLATVPHVVPFGPNSTVAVDTTHALTNTIAECGGRMGWAA